MQSMTEPGRGDYRTAPKPESPYERLKERAGYRKKRDIGKVQKNSHCFQAGSLKIFLFGRQIKIEVSQGQECLSELLNPADAAKLKRWFSRLK